MRILVACEYSGIVSSAFASKGHEVTSCDIIASDYPHRSNVPSFTHHIGDVLQLIKVKKFDMMIGFPPCTWLAQCQLHRQSESDMLNRYKAANFVRRLFFSPIKFVALENPIGWLNTNWRPPAQIVYANEFGSPYGKPICLWLKNLPPLMCGPRSPGKKKVVNHVNSRMTQEQKSKIKSKFFPEVAEAMATQWTEEYLFKNLSNKAA